METMSLNQLKTVVQNLSPNERIALREYLDEFTDYGELDRLISEFRAANPTADSEQIMATVTTAIKETRNANSQSRIRHKRVRERTYRKARATRPRS